MGADAGMLRCTIVAAQAVVAAVTATNGIFAGRNGAKKGPASPFAQTFRRGN
jgi:hypothetical protein